MGGSLDLRLNTLGSVSTRDTLKIKDSNQTEEIFLKMRSPSSKAPDRNAYLVEWQNVIFQTISATALAIISTGSIVFLTDYDFGWLSRLLFIVYLS